MKCLPAMHGNESESYLDERRQQSNWLGPLESSNASLKNRLGDMLSQFDGASLELVNSTDTKMHKFKNCTSLKSAFMSAQPMKQRFYCISIYSRNSSQVAVETEKKNDVFFVFFFGTSSRCLAFPAQESFRSLEREPLKAPFALHSAIPLVLAGILHFISHICSMIAITALNLSSRVVCGHGQVTRDEGMKRRNTPRLVARRSSATAEDITKPDPFATKEVYADSDPLSKFMIAYFSRVMSKELGGYP